MEKQHVVLELENYEKFKKAEEKLEYLTIKHEQTERELKHLFEVLYKSFSKDFIRHDRPDDFLDEYGLKLNYDKTEVIFKTL
jgi:hypothetical protein